MLSAREIAFHALQNWELQGLEIHRSLEPFFTPEVSEREKALAQELSLGVVRRKRTLDEAIHQYSKNRLQNIPLEVRIILRLGLYQLLYLDRVPDHAAVDESVKLARKFAKGRASAFVNALLREFLRRGKNIQFPKDPVQALSISGSFPLELVQRWVKLWGIEKVRELCEAANSASSLTLRVNALKTTRESLLEELKREGVAGFEPSDHPSAIRWKGSSALTGLEAFKKGLFQVQDETMLRAVDSLELQPGLKVLDLCSAPGTKATAIAEGIKDQGLVVAMDVSFSRLRKILENVDRLGLHCVRPLVADVNEIPFLFRSLFDRILLDVPCSNTGVLFRRAEARWRFSLADVRKLALLQGKFLEAALSVLKPGGLLVYVTCSIDPIENEEVVRKILKTKADFVLITEEIRTPSAKSSGGYWAKIKRR